MIIFVDKTVLLLSIDVLFSLEFHSFLVGAWSVRGSVHHVCGCLWRPEGGTESHGTGDAGLCEAPRRSCALNQVLCEDGEWS